MFHMLSCNLSWNGQSMLVPLGKKTFLDDCYFDFTRTEGVHGVRYQLHIHPKVDLKMEEIKISFNAVYPPGSRVLCNGYQSWSESRMLLVNEKLPALNFVGKFLFKNYGDQNIPIVKESTSALHSWTYGYVKADRNIQFIGSLNESSGFTFIKYYPERNEVTAHIDCKGMEIQHSFPALDLWVAKGFEGPVLDEYFSQMGIKNQPAKVVGWTSWYQHYTNINEKIISDNLKAIAKKKINIDYFQIDDGYQTKVGDWTSVDQEKFPKGLQPIVSKIKEQGMKPGIWIAPFVCEKDSDIARKNPDWLLKDDKGNPIKVGYNKYWGGWYYALNYYNQEFQNHLISVFHILLEKWNFDLIKIDFLFAAALHPPGNKSRGQVMNESMAFIRHLVGDKVIIGCGVPLGSSFGKVDYCRIGGDIHLEWENNWQNWMRKRERVSCRSAMRSIFSRWLLDGRAFGNDPDVILLREEGNKLSPDQKQSILLANGLLGSLVFTSDNPKQWSKTEVEQFNKIKYYQSCEVTNVNEFATDQYQVDFTSPEGSHSALFNLTKAKQEVKLNQENIELLPYQSKILLNE